MFQKCTCSTFKKKSNLHYTHVITPKRLTSGGVYLRGLAPGQHFSKETSQRWRAVGGNATYLADPGFEPMASGTDSDDLSNWANRQVSHFQNRSKPKALYFFGDTLWFCRENSHSVVISCDSARHDLRQSWKSCFQIFAKFFLFLELISCPLLFCHNGGRCFSRSNLVGNVTNQSRFCVCPRGLSGQYCQYGKKLLIIHFFASTECTNVVNSTTRLR